MKGGPKLSATAPAGFGQVGAKNHPVQVAHLVNLLDLPLTSRSLPLGANRSFLTFWLF